MTLRYVKRGDVILPDDHNAVRQAFIDLCDTVKEKSPGAPDVQARCNEIKAKVETQMRVVSIENFVLASDHNFKREVLRIDIPALWELVSAYQAEFVDKRSELIDKASLIPERKYGDYVPAEDHNSVIRALELARTQAEQVWIPVFGKVIWHCDWWADRFYELSVEHLSVLRSAASPYTTPHAVGGSEDVIWSSDTDIDRVYELSTVDLSAIRSAPSPGAAPTGIGGTPDLIWHGDIGTGLAYELSTIDFSILRSAVSAGLWSAGGDPDVFWSSDALYRFLFELSPIDFSIVRQVTSPWEAPHGMGGNPQGIWHCDEWPTPKVAELSPVDFSVIRYAPAPYDRPSGIGGK